MLLDAAALTYTNAHCDLQKASCATQILEGDALEWLAKDGK